ncbi:hypothetical protein TEA_024126 [Camellia sinensis var. sinensis]|uniref:Translation initiation factor 5A C-terminal domain-containing protein n=1 Tax=Camellia sinensis var. sinensis TaxID=542762 RepID=A0A4S4E2C8_CAMSN|nr:hypothetical protein TEA_024126 [Camellia sinensis var. sinensis]
MSDEEHHFESKADAGASKTYPQQAGTIRKNGYIVIKNRPCKVVEVSTSKTGKHGHAKCHFVAIDIFNGKKLEDIVPSSHNCDVPHVNRTDYQLIDISEDGFVSLLTENGNTKDDLRLPTDESLLTQPYVSKTCFRGFSEGKGKEGSWPLDSPGRDLLLQQDEIYIHRWNNGVWFVSLRLNKGPSNALCLEEYVQAKLNHLDLVFRTANRNNPPSLFWYSDSGGHGVCIGSFWW